MTVVVTVTNLWEFPSSLVTLNETDEELSPEQLVPEPELTTESETSAGNQDDDIRSRQ